MARLHRIVIMMLLTCLLTYLRTQTQKHLAWAKCRCINETVYTHDLTSCSNLWMFVTYLATVKICRNCSRFTSRNSKVSGMSKRQKTDSTTWYAWPLAARYGWLLRPTWFEFYCCKKRFRNNSSLKRYLADIHDINVKLFSCSCFPFFPSPFSRNFSNPRLTMVVGATCACWCPHDEGR